MSRKTTTKDELTDLYLKALELEEAGDVEAAFQLYLLGDKLGDDGAQHAIGCFYDSGRVVEQDKQKALYWFKKAYRTSKYSTECSAIALTYAEIGQRRRALWWWNKAIAKGDGSANLYLAQFLLKEKNGVATPRIIRLLNKAATSDAPLCIAPIEKEEAQELLDELTNNQSNS